MEDEIYALSEGACMTEILKGYGFDTSHVTMTIAEHMLEDLMDLLVRQGYVKKMGDERDGKE